MNVWVVTAQVVYDHERIVAVLPAGDGETAAREWAFAYHQENRHVDYTWIQKFPVGPPGQIGDRMMASEAVHRTAPNPGTGVHEHHVTIMQSYFADPDNGGAIEDVA